jgi:hypothetical protein
MCHLVTAASGRCSVTATTLGGVRRSCTTSSGKHVKHDYMASSKVMTLRIDPELPEQLREVARAERRSVSAQPFYLVRNELAPPRRRATRRVLPTLGWLHHLDAPDDLDAYRRVRRILSRLQTRPVHAESEPGPGRSRYGARRSVMPHSVAQCSRKGQSSRSPAACLAAKMLSTSSRSRRRCASSL